MYHTGILLRKGFSKAHYRATNLYTEVGKMSHKRLVISLGHKDLGTNMPEQKEAIAKTSKLLANLIADNWQLAIVHSNAPQLGMIHTAMNEFSKLHTGYTNAPMSVCSAMSQGYIGYDLQNTLYAELIRRGIHKTVTTVITQVIVDPYDEAFYKPLKRIGRFMSEEEAKLEDEKGNHTVYVEGKGYQRIVASPNPISIVEIDAINALMDAGQVVIACGGGGIPVIEQASVLKGATAVIEKDLSSGLLARSIDADVLLIATAVDHVSLNFGTEKEEAIPHMSTEAAKKYIDDGHFEFASMLPKVKAGLDFVSEKNGRKAIITSLSKLEEALLGKAGTIIE